MPGTPKGSAVCVTQARRRDLQLPAVLKRASVLPKRLAPPTQARWQAIAAERLKCLLLQTAGSTPVDLLRQKQE
jgi:hypothetical protein